jgi:hypothetical protein
MLRPKAANSTQFYSKSEIYKLTCKTCQQVYVWQTSRSLEKQRYQEHIRYIRKNDPQSAFAQHILNNQHEYGTIDEVIKLLKPTNHTPLLIPYELFFIQSHHQHGQLISEKNPGELKTLIQRGVDTIHSSRDYLINTNSQDTLSISHSTLATVGHHLWYVHVLLYIRHFRQFLRSTLHFLHR